MITTLDLVLRQVGGAVRVSEACAADLVGIALKTLRNHRLRGKELLQTAEIGGRRFVDVRSIADFLDGGQVIAEDSPHDASADKLAAPPAPARRGRPTNRDRAAARAAGFVSVVEWRQAGNQPEVRHG